MCGHIFRHIFKENVLFFVNNAQFLVKYAIFLEELLHFQKKSLFFHQWKDLLLVFPPWGHIENLKIVTYVHLDIQISKYPDIHTPGLMLKSQYVGCKYPTNAIFL